MARSPNLVFIFPDQQRVDMMSCYGNDRIRTPNLNALAGESFVFRHAYASQPICGPARSTILTGLYPHTNGCITNIVPLRPETQTIAEMVSEDYICGYFGKWDLGDDTVPQHGFEKRVSMEDGRGYRSSYSKKEYLSRLSDYHYFLIENGFVPDIEVVGAKVFSRRLAARLPERFTKAAFLGREAARFIRENRERPFMLYVSFLEPHMPYTGPFDDLYSPEEIPTGPHFLQRPPQNASAAHRLLADRFLQFEYEGHDLRTEVGWRKLRAQYWGLVVLMDRAVGEILRALDETGVSEDTIAVFTSDHGDLLGDHCILDKCVLYEEAVSVPLVVRVPWLGRQQRLLEGRISQVDLVPTLLDLMAQPVPGDLQGESRAGVIRGETTLEGNDVFIEWNSRRGRWLPSIAADKEAIRILELPWRTVVSAEGWKLNLSLEDQCEFYDLNADPYEQMNLFDQPAQRGRIRELTERIRRWQRDTEDSAPLPEGWGP